MRRVAYLVLMGLWASASVAQEHSDLEKFTKSGVSFGVLPAVSYDNDLGFQYGLLSNIYWYGTGENYPNYEQSLYVEVSRFAAGTMLARVNYDSPEALSGISRNARLLADVTWFRDLTMDFSGFNGRKTVWDKDLIDKESDEYLTRIFYKHHRRLLRAIATVRYDVPESNVYWQAGFTLFDMKIESVHRNELRRSLPDTATLYDIYCKYNVLRPAQQSGGRDCFLRASIGIDSRDNEAFATKGVWSELTLAAAPGFWSEHTDGFLRATLMHRQYISLGSPERVLAYRVVLQNKICGRVPFYILPHITTSTLTAATSQGLGGSKTMRGTTRNRIVADGVALANVEYRWLLTRFEWQKAQWAIGLNVFGDFGLTTQEYDVDLSGVPTEQREWLFRTGHDCLHTSAGLGLKIHMNTNFIISADFGKSVRKDDGKQGFYVTMNYLF